MAPDESIARQILAASAAEPPKLAAAVSVLAPLTKPLRVVLGFTVDYVVPVYVGAFKLGYRVYELLPHDLFTAQDEVSSLAQNVLKKPKQ